MEVKNKANGKCEPVEVLAWMIDSSLLSLGIREDFEHWLTPTDMKTSIFLEKHTIQALICWDLPR